MKLRLTKARTLCADYDLRFQNVVDGRCGHPAARHRPGRHRRNALLGNAFDKSGPLRWTHPGHVLHRTVLRRERIAICPAYAVTDIQAEPNLRPQAAVYGRCAWLMERGAQLFAARSPPRTLRPASLPDRRRPRPAPPAGAGCPWCAKSCT